MNIPKFRAYIKATGKIHQVATINLPSQTIQAYTKKVKINFESRLTLYGFDEIELMQYIGRKDFKGNEIYAGDILGDYCGVGFIEYCNEQAQWVINVAREISEIHFWEIKKANLKVIGNIYQHSLKELEEI